MSTVLPSAGPRAARSAPPAAPRWAWLPPIGTWKYYALLAALGIFVLGPLGGVTASYMNFAIGFFVGGQVVAGILGSTVTFGYGPEGKHGANYMQTAAASVAGMSAMGVLIQAMVWMGLPQPPVWQLMLFMGSIGMFGAGVGMLYTPILVDRLQLTFPSGFAVANILRALTDPALLKRSVARLGGGIASGIAGGLATAKVAALGVLELSTSTLGAGMLVGPRIGLAALTAGLTGSLLIPTFVSIGWLQAGDPFRKITFLIGLGLIMGAAMLDIGELLTEAWRRWRASAPPAAQAPEDAWKRMSYPRLAAWIAFWGAMVVTLGATVLQQPVGFLLLAVALVMVFSLIVGISLGISDSAPISAAFVAAIVLMAALGLKDPTVGLMAGGILLVACSVGSDMQQDRSTGWRLGTPRTLQFRFQVLGLVVGAVASVGFAKLFMSAYPVLALDQTAMSAAEAPAQWQSAMTYKFVGALRSLTDDKPYQRHAILLGIALGFAIQLLRKTLFATAAYRRFKQGRRGAAADFVLDAVVLPSPYAYSFGSFFGIATSAWLAVGGVVSGTAGWIAARRGRRAEDAALPADMSTTSLVGGGLIAGDALAALGLGAAGLLATLAG
ncbi:MAG TPA: OPT/YSL family transporter [Methylibium sp.]|uniref:OPT/YSL family transporter n=1 Tax=Methylibium sp. TaxID=2067992 RepID=UPI002DB6924E|nr:OPT/YSL family transporter [Methylibium sp.]HEU4458475.1 OPT/YSL family transporter [Methylibium sp.]